MPRGRPRGRSERAQPARNRHCNLARNPPPPPPPPCPPFSSSSFARQSMHARALQPDTSAQHTRGQRASAPSTPPPPLVTLPLRAAVPPPARAPTPSPGTQPAPAPPPLSATAPAGGGGAAPATGPRAAPPARVEWVRVGGQAGGGCEDSAPPAARPPPRNATVLHWQRPPPPPAQPPCPRACLAAAGVKGQQRACLHARQLVEQVLAHAVGAAVVVGQPPLHRHLRITDGGFEACARRHAHARTHPCAPPVPPPPPTPTHLHHPRGVGAMHLHHLRLAVLAVLDPVVDPGSSSSVRQLFAWAHDFQTRRRAGAAQCRPPRPPPLCVTAHFCCA